MKRHRGILTIVALVALGTLSLGVGLELYRRDRLPDPEVADGDALMKWLATRELSEETPEIRQKLVRRLGRFLDEQDPQQPFDLQEVLGQLDDDQTEQFWSNVYLLAELWFLERVETYHQLDEDDRQEFLSGTIDRVKTWGVLDWTATDTPAGAGFAAQAGLIGKQMQPWIDAREDDERKKIEQFLSGLRNFFLAEEIKRWMSG